MKAKVSPARSFEGWSLKEFLLGLKRPVVMLAGIALGYFAGYPEWAWVVSGLSAERLWGLIEFWIKKMPLK